MAHLVESMAYVGQTPWHGLGNELARRQSLEVWAQQEGMNWHIEAGDVRYISQGDHLGSIHAFPGQKVLYRSDTKAPLSVVPDLFQVVQPEEILSFYKDLTEAGGYELETAGVLKGGRKLWALARTGQKAVLKGRDEVNDYLLLATRPVTARSRPRLNSPLSVSSAITPWRLPWVTGRAQCVSRIAASSIPTS